MRLISVEESRQCSISTVGRLGGMYVAPVNVSFVKDTAGKMSMLYERDGEKITAPRKE
jgi:hypothetical protein